MHIRVAPVVAAVLVALFVSPIAAQQVVDLPASDRALSGTPRTLYTVGVDEGRPEEQFTNIPQLAFDSDESLYILDTGNHRVVVFDREGRFVRQIGRRGNGPGELNTPTGVTISADGKVVVQDIGNGNISVFERDGTFRFTLPIDRSRIIGTRPLQAHPVAGVLVVGSPGFDPANMATPPDMNVTRVLWQQLRERTEPASLVDVPSSDGFRQVEMTQRAGGSQVTFRMPAPRAFAPQTSLGILADGGLAVAGSAVYEVRIFSPTGDHLRTIRRPLQPRRVTERDKERERQRQLDMLARGGGLRVMIVGGGSGAAPPAGPSREQQEERIRNMEFADVIPVIERVTTDPWGRAWIARTGDQLGQPTAIDIITGQGRYVGTITGQRLPAAFSRSGRVAYVERDELDIVRVRVAELPATWR